MIQTLARNWWMLALCGLLDAAIAASYVPMLDPDGPMKRGLIVLLGNLTIAAGVAAVAAGSWKAAKGICWPLLANGLALGTLGYIYRFLVLSSRAVNFLSIALLIIVMAIAGGALAWEAGRTLRTSADQWLLRIAGVTSAAFAAVFLSLGLGWVRIEPGSRLELVALTAYFGFSALCMLGLALRLRRLDAPASGSPLPPLPSPTLAH